MCTVDRTVIEYPMFIIGLPEHLSHFATHISIQDDEDESMEVDADVPDEADMLEKESERRGNDFSSLAASKAPEKLDDGVVKDLSNDEELEEGESFLELLKKYETEDIEKLKQIVLLESGALEE